MDSLQPLDCIQSPRTCMRARVHPLQRPPCARRASHRHVKCEPADQQTGSPDSARLDGPCKRLRLSTLPITQYKRSHMEWGFTLLKCILTCENRRQGGRGSSRPGWRRQRRIRPLRFFICNWPFALACTRRHATLLYVRQDTLAVRSSWPSPLHRRKCSGLFSCPTPVAWPTVASATVV